jgi:hypothetical protein
LNDGADPDQSQLNNRLKNAKVQDLFVHIVLKEMGRPASKSIYTAAQASIVLANNEDLAQILEKDH